jgi:RND family efflux transporter MFP subunit
MKWLKSLLIMVLVLGVLLGLGFLGLVVALGAPESETVSIEKIQDDSGIPIKVVSPVPVQFTDYFYCDGDVVADIRTVIRAKVSEIVEAVHVKVGEPVHKGQVLVEFRQSDVEAEIQAAESAYAEAQNNYKRYVQLAEGGVIPDDQLEGRRTRLDAMASQLAAARSRLAFCQPTSPIDGIVEKRGVEPGEYKGIGDELIAIVDLGTVEVAAFVSEEDISHVSVGTQAEFQLEAEEQWRTGTVARISPSTIDPNRFFDIFLRVANTKGDGSWLMRPGMYAEVRFRRAHPLVEPAIPDSCLVLEGTSQVVYLAEPGTIERTVREPDTRTSLGARLSRGLRKVAALSLGALQKLAGLRGEGAGNPDALNAGPGLVRHETVHVLQARRMVVQVGLRENQMVELLDDPLSPGDRVIVNPRDDIRNGTTVRTVEPGEADD